MRDVIRNVFENDEDIFKFFDPSAEVKNVDEIVENIYDKIKSYDGIFETKFIQVVNGYFFYIVEPKLLISFGLNKEYRNDYEFKIFWHEIIEEIGNKFECFLFSKNIRAIKWVQKMGMKIKNETELDNNKITILCL